MSEIYSERTEETEKSGANFSDLQSKTLRPVGADVTLIQAADPN